MTLSGELLPIDDPASGSPVPDPDPSAELSRLRELARRRTPARILVGRAGGSYRTSTQLQLRADLASARDAVTAELDLEGDLGRAFVERWGLFEVATRARSKAEFLANPDLGRALDPSSRMTVQQGCPAGADIQVAIGDGLSVAAVRAQVPALLPLLLGNAATRGWRFGQVFAIRHCRVGVLNELGELLDPSVVILLVGERPGLATAESLSAYMAFRPRPGDDDSRRNLISNIHARGVSADEAAARIMGLAEQMMRAQCSGLAIKESAESSDQALP
jgi:ethanolamine ammonia-lyase small subunit